MLSRRGGLLFLRILGERRSHVGVARALSARSSHYFVGRFDRNRELVKGWVFFLLGFLSFIRVGHRLFRFFG